MIGDVPPRRGRKWSAERIIDLIVDYTVPPETRRFYTVPPETRPFLHGTAGDLAVSGRRLEKRKEALTLVGVLDE